MNDISDEIEKSYTYGKLHESKNYIQKKFHSDYGIERYGDDYKAILKRLATEFSNINPIRIDVVLNSGERNGYIRVSLISNEGNIQFSFNKKKWIRNRKMNYLIDD